MAIISTNRATERLSRRLQKAGLDFWVGKSSGDSVGKYLLFVVGGKCVAGLGWSIVDAEKAVAQRIATDGK